MKVTSIWHFCYIFACQIFPQLPYLKAKEFASPIPISNLTQTLNLVARGTVREYKDPKVAKNEQRILGDGILLRMFTVGCLSLLSLRGDGVAKRSSSQRLNPVFRTNPIRNAVERNTTRTCWCTVSSYLCLHGFLHDTP